jgi:hypothetical protein
VAKSPPRPPQKRPEEPRKPKGDDLAEVERALSVLGGHHPEHVRATREINEARAKKRAEDVANHASARARASRRLLIAIPCALAVLALGWLAYARVVHAAWVERSLEGPTALFAPRGFTPQATGEGELDQALEPGCYVAVTPDEGSGKLQVEHGGETLLGERSVGWCTCTPEHAGVRADCPTRILRAEGKTVGNLDGLGAAEPRPRALSPRVEDCADEQLDAWLALKKYASAAVDTARFDGDSALTPLRSAGFVPVAVVPEDSAFAVVDGGRESCFLAVGAAAEDTISLRLQGGARPVRGAGAIGWCSEKERSVTVWRQGKGEVRVVAAPAARVAGVLGLRERAVRARLPNIAPWIDPDELAWDAAATLRGSAVSEARLALKGNATEATPEERARLVAISLAPGGAWAADRKGGIPYLCDPVTDGTTVLQAVCAQLAPQIWRQTGVLGAVGIAEAPLPFWLAVFAGVKDPELPKSLVALLVLARRLRGDGFEPTTLAGVVEEPNGVSVIGRAGDDAIVAVGLGPTAPYVFPYSDGAEWHLSGEPRVVELAPGERAVLSSVETPSAPKEQRRTVVFRRAAQKVTAGR